MADHDNYDSEAGPGPLSPAKLLFARLLGGRDPIEEATESACQEYPDLAGELQFQLQKYQQRKAQRKIQAESVSEEESSADGLAEKLLDRYSNQFELSQSPGGDDTIPLIPDLQGRYDLLDEIARGGMGAILRVNDPVLHRELAMKVVLGNESGDAPPQRLRRFLREARVTAQLAHPGIVPVHELNSDPDGRFFFTMHRIHGREFRDFIRYARDGTEGWDRNRLLEVLLKVCDTLEYAHCRGIVHRDVKPANIMVGTFGEVYMMDWGLARILADVEDEPIVDILEDNRSSSLSGSTVITRDGAVVGTPSYMSPEQANPEQGEIGAWTDVYAIGALLYEILSGRPPYRTGDIPLPGHKVLRLLQKGPPADILEMAPDTPLDLAEICRLAMKRDHADRPASAGHVSVMLREVLKRRAEAAEEAAKAQEIAKRSREVSTFLADLFLQGAGEDLSLHRISAQELLDRGTKDLLDGREDQPQTRATLLASLSSILLQTGSAEQAALLLEAETELRANQPNWAPEERVLALRNLARAYKMVRKLTEAETALQEALETVPVATTPHMIQHELATLLHVRGDYCQAEEIIRDLLRDLSVEDAADRAPFLKSLAISTMLQGYHEEAREVLQEVIELIGEQDPEELASVLLLRAGTYLELFSEDVEDELLPAQADLMRSIELLRGARGERSALTARHQRALACCQQRSGDLEAAESNARSALVTVRQLHVIQHPLCARSFARLASILIRAGRAEEASKLLEEASMTIQSNEIAPELRFNTLEARIRIDALAGREDDARELLDQLDEMGDELPLAQQRRRRSLTQICIDSGLDVDYDE